MENQTYPSSFKKIQQNLLVLLVILLTLVSEPFGVRAAVINCYPQSMDFWTGTVNNVGQKYQSSYVYARGGGGDRGWMKFDISGIPDGSTINTVTLKYYIVGQYNPAYYIKKLSVDPVVTLGTTIYSQIGFGAIYHTVTFVTAGQNSKALTGSTILTDLTNALGSDWFALGLQVYNSSSSFYFNANGWNQTPKPYLEINYTTNFSNDIGIDSISSPTNLSCEGVYPVIAKLFNGGINTISSATLNWSVNFVNQSPVNWVGSLPPGGMAYVTLGNYTFNPGNPTIFAQASLPNGVNDPFPGNNNKTVIIQIIPKPSIYVQPTDQSIGVGGNATFSLVAAGGNITYQWQISTNNGQSFANLSNAPPYSNVTSNNLLITSAGQSMNGYKYRCVVSGICPPPAITDTVTLSVGPPVEATAGTGYACPGGIALVPILVKNLQNSYGIKLTLKFIAGNVAYVNFINTHPLLSGLTVTPGAGNVAIEWASGSPVSISEDTICVLRFNYNSNSTLIFDTLIAGNCQFSGTGGLAYPSHYYNGTVTNGTPSILTQPDDKLAITGIPAFFRVISQGLPTYQWQISVDNGASYSNLTNVFPYQGVDKDTLHIINPTLSMSGYKYRCVLDGCSYSTNSFGATLTVIKLVKTWMDTIYSCPCTTPYPDIVVPIKVANFDSISSVSLSIMYKTAALQYMGIQNIHPNLLGPSIPHNTTGNPYSTFRFAFYDMLGTVAVPDGETLFELKFKVLCDTTKVMWETWQAGACQYSTGLTIFDADFVSGYVLDGGPFVDSHPSNVTLFAGDTATFSCSGTTFASAIGYQWQESTNGGSTYNDLLPSATYMGVTSPTLKVKASLVTMNGYKYRCRITGLCPSVLTNAATMTVNSPPIYLNIYPVNACSGDTVYVPLQVTNFAQVCSFSLKLQYDGTQLEYAGFKQVNSNLPTPGNLSINASADTVIMSWWALSQATLSANATLVVLKFVSTTTFTGSGLIWKTLPAGNCQITNCASNNIPTVFNNTTVSVHPLPTGYNVITPMPQAGHYCEGESGVQIGLDVTQLGMTYALYRDGSVVVGYGGVAGTGFGITFNTFGAPGYYQVMAINPVSGCSRWMDGFVTVVIDPLPPVRTVTGGGTYCIGGSGVAVGLASSDANVEYLLYRDGMPVQTLSGTGAPLSFGNQTIAGTYTVMARNAWTETCLQAMSGSAVVGITPLPSAAGAINGTTVVCQGESLQYSVAAIPSATTYSWVLPSGVTGTSTSSSIVANFTTSAQSGLITVTGQNSCGSGVPATLGITVNPLPANAGSISGPSPVCQGATAVVYTVPAIADASSYVWTLPNGFNLVSNNQNSITVNVGTLATSGNITVKGQNACGFGSTATLAVQVSPLPGNASMIIGSTSPCQGAVVNYSHQPIQNASQYTWTLPNGASGSSTTNSISVTYSVAAQSGTITVTPQNACGTGNPAVLPITVQPLPATPQSIVGPISVCKNTSNVCYSVSPLVQYAGTYAWTSPSGVTGTSTTSTLCLNFGSSASSGNITVKGQNNCGFGPVFVLPVTVNNQPTVTLANFPAVCLEGGNISLSGGSPAGGTYSGPGVTNGILDPTVAGLGTHTITYNYTDGNNCSNSATRQLTINQLPRITGTVVYDNLAATTMGNVKVYLKNSSNVIIDSTLTGVGLGAYWFRCLANGQYNLSATTTRPWPSGPINANDALMIMQHSVGMITLSPFRQRAGDVNNSNSLNAGDALLVMRRFVGAISSFSIPNWLFDINNPSTISGADQLVPIKALCAGDVDANNVPSAAKTEPNILLGNSGQLEIVEGETYQLPLRVKNDLTTNALSLILYYPAEAIDLVQVSSKLPGFVYNILQGELRFAWYSLDGIHFKEGEAVITLEVKAKSRFQQDKGLNFSIDPHAAFSNHEARLYDQVELILPALKYGIESLLEGEDFSLGYNYPNPFQQTTDIEFRLPEPGMTRLSVLNLLGEEVQLLVEEKLQAGEYKISFNAGKLSPGMYQYKLALEGKEHLYNKTRNMVIVR